MNVYLEVTFDTKATVDPGESLVHWFRAARTGLFGGLVEAEARGGEGVFSQARVTHHIDDSARRFLNLGDSWGDFEECLAAFPWGAGLTFFKDEGELGELGRASSYHVHTDGSFWQASAAVTVGFPDDAGSCAALVEFLRGALDASNPTFGRIELNNFNDLTNLDAALLRKRRKSLREGRQFLRGYAWTTVCPAELSARLGGVTALEASGAFHRVVPLRAGGALLQASETLAGYTDAVMERVFEVLAPVLPEGEPRPDPAYPYMRFVPRDAASVR